MDAVESEFFQSDKSEFSNDVYEQEQQRKRVQQAAERDFKQASGDAQFVVQVEEINTAESKIVWSEGKRISMQPKELEKNRKSPSLSVETSVESELKTLISDEASELKAVIEREVFNGNATIEISYDGPLWGINSSIPTGNTHILKTSDQVDRKLFSLNRSNSYKCRVRGSFEVSGFNWFRVGSCKVISY